MNFKKDYPNGFVFGLIAGHGGLGPDSKYNIIQAGSKQAKLDNGKVVYEGVENRLIKDTLLSIAEWETSVEVIDLVPGYKDITLGNRVNIVNNTFDDYKKQGKLLLVWEIHNNAFNGKVKGTEVFTTTADNFSDIMAEVWLEKVKAVFSGEQLLTNRPIKVKNGQPIRGHKQKDFMLIRDIKTFGVLLECFFFDNPEEVELYCNPKGYYNWALTILLSMLELNKEYYG